MTRRHLLGLAAASVPLLRGQSAPPRFVTIADDFSRGSGGWLAGFSDYGFAQGGMQRIAEPRPLPAEVNASGGRRGYYVHGFNNSDDLFMYLKKPLSSIDGIAPGASYEAEFFIEAASDAPSGCAGVGGSPGDSVYLKVGASATEPVAILDPVEGVRLNLDKGQQSQSGADATVAGTIGNGAECVKENLGVYRLIERRQKHASPVRASDTGNLWLFVGTDSAFEGMTGIYYARIVVSLTRLDEGGVR